MRKIEVLMVALVAALLLGGCMTMQGVHAAHMGHMMGMPEHSSATHLQLEHAVARAHTRAEHEAAAQLFEQEAKAAEDRAAEFRKLTQTYESTYGVGVGQASPPLEPGRDSEMLVSLYEQVASQDRALAYIHRQLATEAKE
jgi:hypothetical protein